MRGYLRSHDFIDFKLDLNQLDWRAWHTLGQVEESLSQLADTLLPPGQERGLHELYLLRGARATIAIEGNTLEEEDIARIATGRDIHPETRGVEKYEVSEARNIVALYNHIAQQIFNELEFRVDVETILDYNRRILRGIAIEAGASPGGEFRSHPVTIGKISGAPQGAPQDDVPYLTQRLCDWLYHDLRGLAALGPLAQGIIRAFLAHLYIAWIHPFADGNGRTARAIELHMLIAANVPDIAAHLPSNFYHRTREEYYQALDQSRAQGPVPFLQYALRGFAQLLREQRQEISTRQRTNLWETFVQQQFEGRNSELQQRRRTLALALADALEEPVAMEKIPQLSPALRAYYFKKPRILKRDLQALSRMTLRQPDSTLGVQAPQSAGIVEIREDGVRGRSEVMKVFQPLSIGKLRFEIGPDAMSSIQLPLAFPSSEET
ncbi:MAG: Fic family protein [Anaerolineaceae bacterium]|nr:Fic family protein [Anaerolineaceae bacterium]